MAEATSEDVRTQLQLRRNAQHRKRPRLKQFEYTGCYAYHLVLLPFRRQALFLDNALARSCASELELTAKVTDFDLLAYCLVPDHVHILLQGLEDGSELLRFVQRFKQKTSFHFKRATGHQLWQQSFYDHALRVPEDLSTVAQYIFWNPVEAGLVERPQEFALSGGTYLPTPADDPDGAKAASLRFRAAFPELATLTEVQNPATHGA